MIPAQVTVIPKFFNAQGSRAFKHNMGFDPARDY